MKWTKKLPKQDGYYWFAMNYSDTPLCLYFTVDTDIIFTYGYFYNDPLYCDESDGYFFSDTPQKCLEWGD